MADLQGAAQQPDLALSAVYRSLLCDLVFWELLAVGPGCTAAELGGVALPPS